MLSSLFQSTTIPILQEVVNFAQSRHSVLAGNLANMDTPGYKVRDLSEEDFQQRLKAAIQRSRQPSEPRSPGEPAQSGAAEAMAEISQNPKTILHHDQSNVGIEYQVSEMVKNQLKHNLALTIMTDQLQLLQTAVSERL